MNNFETYELREISIKMFNLKNLDKNYIFFYDETNNIRRYYLKEDKFNESIKTNFILGGLVFEKEILTDFKTLFESFKLQDNISEVKLKHIATGDFEDCLKSKKISLLLEFILKNNCYLHFSTLNFLYFSTVDIIDSLIEASQIEYDPFINRILKNDLYLIIKNNQEIFIPFLYEYEYPNIKEERVIEFINKFIEHINKFELDMGLKTILMLLEKSKKTQNLTFIMNEENHTLINEFSIFYSRTVYLFKESKHYFDKEDSIEPLLNAYSFTSQGIKICNYEFIDSNNNLLIQTSDILVGLIGKYYNFINEFKITEINDKINQLNEIQNKNLILFFELLSKSENYSKAFIHQTISNDDISKIDFITKKLKKNYERNL